MSGWGKEWINAGDPNWTSEAGKLPKGQYGKLNTEPNEWPKGQSHYVEEAAPISDEAWANTLQAWPNPVALGVPNVGVAINEIKNLKSQGSNLVDSEAYLYFQCEGCSTILDPHTKSFKTLQEQRVKDGWLCVWNTNGQGYKVFCVKCGNGK